MTPHPATLMRSEACVECGETMLWTQNAWPPGQEHSAAYRCANGHVCDPLGTRQCPECGVHDTRLVEQYQERATFVCNRCQNRFEISG